MSTSRREFFWRSTLALAGSSLPFARSRSAEEPDSVTPRLVAKDEITKKLAALEPNTGVNLGRADIVGEFNETAKKFDLHKTGPRGRDFTLKMCWAPDRKRALFLGANHAVPHRLNDVWEFDLPSLTWAMLYAPDLPRGYLDLGKDTSDVEFKDGLFFTKRGGPAIIAHTWWGLTYDPKKKALLFMNSWVTDQINAAKNLKGDPATLYLGPPLWAFYPETKKWQAFKAELPYPKAIFGGMLEYIPDLNGSVWHVNNWQMRGTWLHDFEKNAWKNLNVYTDEIAFLDNAPAPEQIGYLDPRRGILVAQRQHDTFHFDVKKMQWKRVHRGKKDDDLTPEGHDARSVFYYDAVSGHGILVQFTTNSLWAYDPDKFAWTKLTPKGDPMPLGSKRLAYCDPAQNVLVVSEGANIWAYRYRAK